MSSFSVRGLSLRLCYREWLKPILTVVEEKQSLYQLTVANMFVLSVFNECNVHLKLLLNLVRVFAVIFFADFYTANFARNCFWQFFDELEFSRAFIHRRIFFRKV